MNSLQIKNSSQTMTSREIAELTGKRHDNVMVDIKVMLVALNISTPEFSGTYQAENGQDYNLFTLPKDLVLTLVSGYNVVMRKRIIDRWLELEAAPAFKVPQSMSEALRLAADLSDKVIEQAKQIEAAAPCVAFVEQYADASNTKSFRQVCKALNANESDFRAFLTARSIMYKLGGEWMPYAIHIDAGRFVVKQGVAGEHAFNSAKFTQKGFLWVTGEWAKFQIKEAA